MATRPLFVGPLLHLRTLQAFEGLAPVHLTALAQEAEEVILRRGTALLSPGVVQQDLYVIVDGQVSLERRARTARAHPGDAVGFIELLAQTPSETRAVAEEDVVALKLDGDRLREVCERHFAILSALLSSVARQVGEDPRALRLAVQGDGPDGGGAPLSRPLDRVGRLVALHRSPAFPSASVDALAELAGALREVHFAEGEPLWAVGDVADGFYLLCNGRVRYASHAGWSVDVGPGGVPGMPATLARSRRTVTASALQDTVALAVDTEPFLDVLEDHFHMAFRFLGRLARCVLESATS